MSEIDFHPYPLTEILQGKSYYIDFYQREYVWGEETVKTLLKDITYHFSLSYKEKEDITRETINKYNWYYLNVCLINEDKETGKQYIVDGQQRLTSLCLIAIKLYHLLNDASQTGEFDNLKDNLRKCLSTKDMFDGNIYSIDHEKRHNVMDFILENKEFKKQNTITETNILARYKDISVYLENFLFKIEKKDGEERKSLDKNKLRAFSYFFLNKLILVKGVINQSDTPMVFEVINDRGVSLKPFEILKGKMLGILEKNDIETYNTRWTDSLRKISNKEDEFFINYLKAKYIYTKSSAIKINNEYHRYIFASNNEISNNLKFRKEDENQIQNIKNFINKDLAYYSELYREINEENKYEFIDYNKRCNDLDGQYQNIIAACDIDDPDKENKIESISKEIDRMYVLLQLNGIYTSNEYTETQYALNRELKDAKLESYREIFNNIIKETIKGKLSKENVDTLLEYNNFSKRGYDNLSKTFLRYLFARIDKYICDNTGLEMLQGFYGRNGIVNSNKKYHIEHILSHNEENKAYFNNSDEEFESERNRLGGLLLLYGRDNESSNNELYSDKLKTYSNSFYWARTLKQEFYHSNKRVEDFNKVFKSKTGLEFKPIDNFDKEALEGRSKLLFEIVKQIWDPSI